MNVPKKFVEHYCRKEHGRVVFDARVLVPFSELELAEITKEIIKNKEVKKIYFTECHMDIPKTDIIKDVFAHENSIEEFFFIRNNDKKDVLLGDKMVQLLSKALSSSLFLKSLSLLSFCENGIRDDGARAVAELLGSGGTNLKSLYLSHNNIGPAGAEALAEALLKNQTLTKLSLRDNRVKDAGARAFARALETNWTLETLDLWNNDIGDLGAEALGTSLQKNTTLNMLVLFDNPFQHKKAFRELLKVNHTITELFLGYLDDDDDDKKNLDVDIKTNLFINQHFCAQKKSFRPLVAGALTPLLKEIYEKTKEEEEKKEKKEKKLERCFVAVDAVREIFSRLLMQEKYDEELLLKRRIEE